MRTLILSLALLLPAHSQVGEVFEVLTQDEIPADPGAPQDVSDKALIPGDIDSIRKKLYAEGTANIDFKSLFRESGSEADKQALRDLKATYEKAIATKDLDLIKPHLASDFTAVMITADEVKDYEGIKEYWKKVEEFIGEDGTYTVSIEPDDTIFEGNIAIAKGIAKEKVVRKGKVIDLVTKWTAIARLEGGKWKLVRIQATIDPVNNPIVTALNKGKLWITGAVGAISGLLFLLLWRRIASAKPSAPN